MDIEAEIDRARTLHRQGNAAAAVPVYRAVLKERPDHPEALHLLGVSALQGGHPRQALDLIGRAAILAPDNPKIQNNLGSALVALERPGDATAFFRRAVELDPEFAEAYYNLGNALGDQRNFDDAREAYRNALRIDPAHAAASNNLGAIHRARGDLLTALELFRIAVDNAPQSIESRSNLVAALEALNRIDEAEQEALELQRVAPELPMMRLLRARLDRRADRLEKARSGLQLALDSAPPLSLVPPLNFEMAHVLDGLSDYSGAFDACARAKRALGRLPDAVQWDLTSYPALVARQREWFTSDRMRSIPETSHLPSAQPVFFVGFPRSGTTLMENILGAHSEIATTGEQSPLERIFRETEARLDRSFVTPDDLESLNQSETSLLRHGFFEIGEAVVGESLKGRILLDKLPLNIIRLGIANWLFPQGRVITALRDPRDVVLSCYMQNFSLTRAMQQFLNLESTARFYADVMDLWLRWRQILTMPWHEYRYEDLIANFDGTVAAVLEFLGLGWDQSVQHFADRARQMQISTPSYEAVTQPIYQHAVGRWRNYREQLAPVLPVLAPYVREFGYDPD